MEIEAAESEVIEKRQRVVQLMKTSLNLTLNIKRSVYPMRRVFMICRVKMEKK